MKGFTLVELMIVVALIVILSTIGAVIYINVLKNARDSIRKADISAISKALEVNRTTNGYIPLQVSQFSKYSASDSSGNAYCIASGFPFTPEVIAPWGTNCPSGFAHVAPGIPTGTFIAWKVCAFLETPEPGLTTHAYCITQSQ